MASDRAKAAGTGVLMAGALAALYTALDLIGSHPAVRYWAETRFYDAPGAPSWALGLAFVCSVVLVVGLVGGLLYLPALALHNWLWRTDGE